MSRGALALRRRGRHDLRYNKGYNPSNFENDDGFESGSVKNIQDVDVGDGSVTFSSEWQVFEGLGTRVVCPGVAGDPDYDDPVSFSTQSPIWGTVSSSASTQNNLEKFEIHVPTRYVKFQEEDDDWDVWHDMDELYDNDRGRLTMEGVASPYPDMSNPMIDKYNEFPDDPEYARFKFGPNHCKDATVFGSTPSTLKSGLYQCETKKKLLERASESYAFALLVLTVVGLVMTVALFPVSLCFSKNSLTGEVFAVANRASENA